jgi:hypothetical protein
MHFKILVLKKIPLNPSAVKYKYSNFLILTVSVNKLIVLERIFALPAFDLLPEQVCFLFASLMNSFNFFILASGACEQRLSANLVPCL